VPAEAGKLVALTSQAGADGDLISNAAAEQVANESFDGVGLIEGHNVSELKDWDMRRFNSFW